MIVSWAARDFLLSPNCHQSVLQTPPVMDLRETEGRLEEQDEIKLEETNQSEQPGALEHSKVRAVSVLESKYLEISQFTKQVINNSSK